MVVASGFPRFALIMTVAVALAIAWLDSRPSWDDAGITALLLFLTAAGSAISGVSWWLSCILAGTPIVLWELWTGPGVLIAIPFVLAGGLAGFFLRRLLKPE